MKLLYTTILGGSPRRTPLLAAEKKPFPKGGNAKVEEAGG
jgi:hypothetical protein